MYWSSWKPLVAGLAFAVDVQASLIPDDHQVTAELVRVTPGHPGSAAVSISWPAFGNALTGTGGVVDVEAYEAQYAVSGSGDWVSLGASLSGLSPDPGAQATQSAAKQRVFTLADAGQNVVDGFFRLALSYEGSSPSPRGGRALAGVVTPPIAFDASDESMKTALESLERIRQVQVVRNALDTVGTFEWIVVFDHVVYDEAAEDPLPLLTLYSETLSALYTGAGDQVAIQALRSPPSAPSLHRRLCVDLCSFEINELPTGEAFTFRVRAQYSDEFGWSSWSGSSKPIRIPATRLPRAPSPPELLAATSSRLTITWRMRRDLQAKSDVLIAELFPVQSFHAQEQCDDEVGWTTISESVSPGINGEKDVFSTVVASLERPPGSSCVFRVAATTANGQGPFSSLSKPFRTLRTAPGPVSNLRVLRNPLRLIWNPPTDLGGHTKTDLTYEVDYRVVRSFTWTRMASDLVDNVQRVANLSAQSLESYTSYVARVRAVVEGDDSGSFVESPTFLTDYTVDNNQLNEAGSGDQSSKPSVGAIQVTMGASRQQAANQQDWYFVQLTAGGGDSTSQAEPGQPGVVLVFPVTWSGERLAERSFFFAGGSQSYRVSSEQQQLAFRIVALDIYAWGAGGASASAFDASGGLSDGGGGAFARGIFRVSAGDLIEVLVGGGGDERGQGGYNGGGNGGTGDFSGGGGGGASEVRVNGRTVLVAAGGGGAGSTSYCCAHGGGGGGLESAEPGLAADATSIPLDLEVTGQAPRDEYHSTNVAGDLRDFSGLPARHEHLNWGFAASSADYSILATGGVGASATAPGLAGTGGSYQYSLEGKCLVNSQTSLMEIAVTPLESSRWASNGQRGRGGSGQSGKKGGGGGGGGFFGGGGGGAGIDGGGGGGGSSFVSFADLFNSSKAGESDAGLRLQAVGESVDQLKVTSLTSSSARVTWKSPQYGFKQLVEGFVVEMANRSANEDFRAVKMATFPSQEAQDRGNVTITDLAPLAAYRFRVKPLLLDGHGSYSTIVTLRMPPKPVNTWQRCVARTLAEEGTRAGLRFTDAYPLQRLPSARRGHSLTALGGFLYLFGGLARSYECNKALKVPCLLQDRPRAVSNELWRYDLLTETWWQVPQASPLPLPREKHSMAVVNDRLLLFGGRQDDKPDVTNASTWGPLALNDLWELSVSSTTARKTSASLDSRQPTSLHLPDGGEVFAIGSKGPSASGDELCVANLTVKLQLTHSCPHRLRLQLFGPGPATFPGRQQTVDFPVDSRAQETTWSDGEGLGRFEGDHRITGTAPNTRAFPVTLQSPDEAADKTSCAPGTHILTFASSMSDKASSVAPLEPLSVFHQLPVAGNWTLGLADLAADGLDGALDTWDVSFDMTPCIPKFTWTNLSAVATGTPPTPRFQHSVVVYQSSMFVFGGTRGGSGLELYDLFRLNYSPSSSSSSTARWTQLSPVTNADSPILAERRTHAGRAALLTPYELMALGRGLKPPTRPPASSRAPRFESQLGVRLKGLEDPLDGWRSVSVSQSDDTETQDERRPVPRYWGASAFVQEPPGSSPPRVYLFGGQDDTTLLDDLWSLELAELNEAFPVERLQRERLGICAWRLENAGYQTRWVASCGASSTATASTKCSMELLLLYAWCGQCYQSITL
ncbi:hypothetical protein BBJ28_00008645 [Nothophytophthora sp. Chile5]|nr:hypothetical protein BBJ28_00008645 [Nothophytophthora sp. Chile5]